MARAQIVARHTTNACQNNLTKGDQQGKREPLVVHGTALIDTLADIEVAQALRQRVATKQH